MLLTCFVATNISDIDILGSTQALPVPLFTPLTSRPVLSLHSICSSVTSHGITPLRTTRSSNVFRTASKVTPSSISVTNRLPRTLSTSHLTDDSNPTDTTLPRPVTNSAGTADKINSVFSSLRLLLATSSGSTDTSGSINLTASAHIYLEAFKKDDTNPTFQIVF